ncbi:MAG: peptidylprolyl isomerase [Myxococcales bacterium]|nr:peptidylprolyl isomerase [Myxococcales bacterium]
MRCALVLLGVALLGSACNGTEESAGTGGSAGTTTITTTTSTGGAGGAVCGPDVAPPDEVVGSTDPEAGVFTLDEALVELPDGPGPLRAVVETSLGTLTCTFHEDVAPNAVANFVGLARGRRAWREPGTASWVRRPFYDGLIFHRVIPGFVAQGGDPLGTGYGGPGYQFADEIGSLSHQDGTLAYANSGANTNGSQFYICDGPQTFLDGGYTIFGECAPTTVVGTITGVPTDANDKPLTPVTITSVTVTRCAP